ncbi:DUF3718 domain-containing protein [Aliiglaciecola lipolytica]|nr:DUF3718 domain-containing protein [Aliiglaciecola lipolytica]
MSIFLANIVFATKAKADINSTLMNICTIVVSDDSSDLRNKIEEVNKHYRLKLRHYYNSISCDGQSLIRAAIINDAYQTAELLIKKLPKLNLRLPESDGKTLQQWIDDKNLSDSPIAITLSNKI